MSQAYAPPPALGRSAVFAIFVISTLIWGSTWIVVRDQLVVVDPTWSIFYRFTIAAIATFAFASFQGYGLWIERRDHVLAIVIGATQFVLNFLFVYSAEKYVTSGVVAVVYALLIVPNALLARIFLGQRIAGLFVVGSIIAIGGLALMFRNEIEAAAHSGGKVLIGLGLSLTGVFFASISNVLMASDGARRLPTPVLLAWSMAWAVLFNAILAVTVAGAPSFDWRPSYIFGLFHLGLFASALAFGLYFRVIQQVGPARAAYTSVVIPVIAMALSTIFEDYRWSFNAVAGASLAMAGLLVALSARRPAEKSE